MWTALAGSVKAEEETLKIAAVVTAYYHNSHADVIVSRLLEGYNLNEKAPYPRMRLASLYVDQFPENDKSRELARKHRFPIFDSVAGALTLGGDTLAVDGVLLVAEHGTYPESETGSIMYPKRRLFGEIVDVFNRSHRVVPVFSDKHLADNWQDAKWIYDTAKERGIPLMAGSSLPVLWRRPPARIERGEEVQEIVAVSYHRLDTYGFHALEMVQTLAEQRGAGETGIAHVQCLEGAAVWDAASAGVYDRKLLAEALGKLPRQLWGKRTIEAAAHNPVLFAIEHRDGLKVNVLTLNGAVGEWATAWRLADGATKSTCFETQEARPFTHFEHLLRGVEQMMHSGKPTWPVERTLLTTGALDALLRSRHAGGKPLDTPWLQIEYQSPWQWHQPPEPAESRPLTGQ
ncbi:MAG: hypothetical protein KDA41_07630 [Planctomycetales bacterium]|nr:hypothetical protein [Planctomycetales bacterium]